MYSGPTSVISDAVLISNLVDYLIIMIRVLLLSDTTATLSELPIWTVTDSEALTQKYGSGPGGSPVTLRASVAVTVSPGLRTFRL